MKDGFIKVAAASVKITVADTAANTKEIKSRIDEADGAGVNLLVLPELCVTGYTCGDLFYSDVLLSAALESLKEISRFTIDKYPVVIVGLPVKYRYKLFNCAAVIHKGRILALIPKTHLPAYAEFYEKRQFSSSDEIESENASVTLDGGEIPFGSRIIFRHSKLESYRFGVEICEDLWSQSPPSEALCKAGCTLIANPSASDELIGKEGYRRLLAASTSARLVCGYIYCNAAPSESTQDMVFSQHHLIYENGTLLAENKPFEEKSLLCAEIDVNKLSNERHKMTSFVSVQDDFYTEIGFEQDIRDTELTFKINRDPFVPSDKSQISERAETILQIQSHGLKKRLEHTRSKTALIGISGGLDSCLALLVAVRAMDMLSRPRKDIIAVSMPCFGTTKRTKGNAEKLCFCLGVTFREINITKAVNRHFEDIGHDPSVHDVTYENCQARERTQVLMDLSNKESGIVVGTGDLSELALGWATYNGDHMSMYGVNSSVPKSLVRYIIRYIAGQSDKALSAVLVDILDTPVSPELLPADESGNISQKTEDLVGPYELHDFFLYYTLRYGFSPSKILRMAKYAYNGAYPDETILNWLKVFIKRFFAQQFKRSCMPDGPKVGSVSLSPRGDWRMPSDASCELWLKDLEKFK
jgi:NAD+ synthase (glutamine-hydrolysing)